MFAKAKRIISTLLAVTMIATMSGIPLTAFADDELVVGDDWSYDKTTGHYYEFVDDYVTYDEAIDNIATIGNGAHIASISSQEENDVIHSTITSKTSGNYWVGLYCENGEIWKWQDGTEVTYLPSEISTKSNAAVYVPIADQTFWYPKDKTGKMNYVIEYDFCPHNQKETINNTYRCDEGGYTGDVVCHACGETIRQGEEKGIDYDGHTYETDDTKLANCFVDGKEGDVVCTKCGVVSEGKIIHIDHNFDENGVCKKCGMIKNAPIDNEYTVDFSNILFNVMSFTPSKNGSYTYTAQPNEECTCDVRAFLYDDYDKMVGDINAFYQTDMDNWSYVENSMTHSVDNYKNVEDNVGKPVIKYSMKSTKTYYVVLMPYSPLQANAQDYYNVKMECAHSSTHIEYGTASCETAGISDKVVCDICGKTLSGGVQIPSYHSEGSTYLKTIKARPSTCFTDGYTNDAVICTVCNQILNDSKKTEMLSHSYDENGVCKNCGLTKIDKINVTKTAKVTSSQPWQVMSYDSNAFGTMTVSLNSLPSYVYVYSSYDKLSSELSAYIEKGCTSYENGGSDVLSATYLLSEYPSVGNVNYNFYNGNTYYFLVIPKNSYSYDMQGSFKLGCNHETTKWYNTNNEEVVPCKVDSNEYILQNCQICGTTVSSSMGAVEHDSITKNAYDATCNSTGYTGDKYCKYCGDLIEEGQSIPNLHSDLTAQWIYKMSGTPATCYTKGTGDYYYCSKCGANVTQPEVTEDYLSHDFNEKGVCKKCGMINNTVLNEKHNKALSISDNIFVVSFTAPTVEKSTDDFSYTFNVSSSENYKASLYSSEDDIRYDCDSQHNGKLTDSSVYHSVGNALKCQLKAGVTYFFVVALVNPTKAERNVIISVDCNHDKQQVITKGVATCTQNGKTDEIVCDICKQTLSQSKEIEAYGHNSIYTKKEVRNAVLASCDNMGYTGDIYCLDCSQLIEKGTEIPSHHNDENYYEYLDDGFESTCIRQGRTSTIVCKECGKVIAEPKPIEKQFSSHHFVNGYCELCGVPEDFLSNDKDGYYVVKSANDFITLCNFFGNSNYEKNINVRLDSDIDLLSYISRYGWNDVSFEGGIFDGNGHIISGVNLDGTGKAKALFNDVKNAEIKNITIIGAVNVNYEYAALLASQANDSLFDNITTDGSVKGRTYIGTIAAKAYNCTFTSCKNNAVLSSSDSSCGAGGIAGFSQDSIFSSCSNNASVTSPNTAGGIVGDGDTVTISDCTNNGAVTATENAGNAGGILGADSQNSSIIGSINSGAVSSNNNSGGIVGSTLKTTVDNCLNEGNINGLYSGGIAGSLSDGSTINKGYNSGTVETSGDNGVASGIAPSTDTTGDSAITNSNEQHTHIWDTSNGVITKQPTCTEEGIKTISCTDCPKKNYESIASLGHQALHMASVEPTCTMVGNTEYYYCSRCNKTFSDEACENEITPESTVVSAKGHNYSSVVTPPTCTEQGFTTYTCTVCGDTYVDSYVNALGHNYNAVVTPPTCTEQGFTTYTCTVCGDTYVDSYVNAMGHNYNAVVTPPTCTEQGFTTYTCTICGDTYVDSYVNAMGHNYNAVVTPPTCTEQGFTTHTCIACDDTYIDSYVSAIGHNYGNNNPTCLNCGSSNPNYVAPPAPVITTSPASSSPAPSVSTTGTVTVGSVSKPKSTKISKLTKGKKQFKVTYKRIGGVTGYEVSYSTSKKFTKKTTKAVKVKGYKTTSKTIKKLKAKKKYYVRVRTYKTVKGKNYYSSWSSVKTVTTK